MSDAIEWFPTTCQYIHQDGNFCDKITGFDKPWCEKHRKIVFVQVELEKEDELVEQNQEEALDGLDAFEDLNIEEKEPEQDEKHL